MRDARASLCAFRPVRVSVRHCLDCRKRSGSAFAVQARRPGGPAARWPDDRVEPAGEPSEWSQAGESGLLGTFRFCAECGVTVAFVDEGMPGRDRDTRWSIRRPGLPPARAVGVGGTEASLGRSFRRRHRAYRIAERGRSAPPERSRVMPMQTPRPVPVFQDEPYRHYLLTFQRLGGTRRQRNAQVSVRWAFGERFTRAFDGGWGDGQRCGYRERGCERGRGGRVAGQGEGGAALYFDDARRGVFLDALRESCHMGRAAAAAGVSVSTVYSHRNRDMAFRNALSEALADGAGRMRQEMLDRAIEAAAFEPAQDASGRTNSWLAARLNGVGVGVGGGVGGGGEARARPVSAVHRGEAERLLLEHVERLGRRGEGDR